MRGSAVLEFDLENNEVQTLVSDFGRIRDTYVEDDDLYFITNNLDGRGNGRDNDDRLVRINLTE
ncbi:glucose dehydrogenase-B [Tetragenococcus muriaticus PMC-11-5]|uniref:Glucose dehydrogenase-B n=1 Tax=Tetragenococcus muriaticus PMC-11-5 TaxID=1302649 RepID=A0A091BWH1_9ENTE|nr:glucose dehydrogenase-B [Tetragenococcus muriaticus PMC-11-5]